MNYKLMYCVLHYEDYGDCWSTMFFPIAFDERHSKTREKVFMTLKEEMIKKIYHFYNDKGIDIDLDMTYYHDTEPERNIYMCDKYISFNENHNTKIISTINKSSEEDEVYLWGYIMETSPNMVKESVSDLEQFVTKENYTDLSDEFMNIFKIKNMLYCSRYYADPDYDTEDRIEYHGGFKSVSKNLMALLLSEDEEFPHEAELFYKYCYPDQDEYNIHNNTRYQTFIKRTLSSVALNRLTKSNILGGNFLLCDCSDNNGFKMSCDVVRVPIVSYIGR